ncbi:N-acetyl sugar amidotransferase [Vicingus serpentipes]|uniref:N-acetyl sugar amidotransferase n=1 Tax=Vicingus serpentipes TaxID=1926625 RepID=A0A5C6RZ92_9FLAO|nr:N-acetyl sugar amidotransferase [Vicingus serpentipes]TXB67275.1 N-acetyl sugar amidotransferase [Vicingus serpentipes]
MKKKEYKQCTRCVMDTSDPFIEFDEEGYCNHCKEFFEKTAKLVYQGEETDKQLAIELEKIKQDGKGNPYDCIIGVSGGIDSSYVLYKAVQLGLRPLAVHMDNGWNSEEAVKNIKNVCSKLGVDYQSYVLDWEEFKDIQLAFLRASIVEMEIPTDTAIPAALHKIAANNKVKHVISGGNYATEGILPNSWFYDPKDLKLLKSIHRKYGTKKLKTFPAFDYKKEIYYKKVRGIRIFYLLNYVPFSKDDAMALLQENLGWQYYGGKHYESKFTGFIQSYLQPIKFGVDYRKATFSTQICTGEITREEAIKELKNLPYNAEKIDAEKEYVAKKLGITLTEFEDILALPIKTYNDYPNNEKLLTFLYNTYRKLKINS